MEPTAPNEPVDENVLYDREAPVTPALETLAKALNEHEDAVRAIMAEKGVSEAEARNEMLKQVFPEVEAERRSLKRRLDFDSRTGVGSTEALQKAHIEADLDPGLAFVHIDLNNFGNYNKITSQMAGHQLLKDSADKMKEVMAELDLPPRIFRDGGDEFVIIVPKDKAEEVRDKVETAIGVQEYRGVYDGAEKTVVFSASGAFGPTLAESENGLQERKMEHKHRYGGETSKLPEA